VRILICHSRYATGHVSGENRVVEDEAALLRDGGHEVDVWAPAAGAPQGLDLVRLGAAAIWSPSAAKEVAERVRRGKIEVVHFHNLFPMLSPAAIAAARSSGAAVVMTLHNYRLLCVSGTLRRDGRRCEDCLGRSLWRGVVHGCYRDSSLGSASLASSLTLHRALRTFDAVGLFLPVSNFVRDKYVEAGVSASRMRVKPNFAWPSQRRDGPGDHFLFVGRLSPEKGVDELMRAWQSIPARLVVIGDGPEEEAVRRLAPPNVEFLGALPSEDIPEHLRQARALLVPSHWPDSAPRVVLEAYACGVPVIANAVGGLPDLIDDNGTGLLIRRDTPEEWRNAIRRLADDQETKRLGDGSWRLWESRFSPHRAIQGLEQAYTAASARLE
jgi:glycosyltransferase involved in cell wall biosynthesis